MATDTIPNPAKNVTRELAHRSRNRKRVRAAEVELNAVPSIAGRNDLLPELRLEKWPIAKLHAPKRQVRNIEPHHVAEVARSIAAFGISRPPVVTTDGQIIDGVTTVEAARHLGLQDVPCIVVGHLSDRDTRLLRLALNRLSERGNWNVDALKLEFQELIAIDAPVIISGFAAPEIDLILLDEPTLDATANACTDIRMNTTAVTQPGDLWLLGSHRLFCGDACSPDSYEQLFAGTTIEAQVMFADPPYNIPIKGFVTGQAHHRDFVMGAGEMSDDEFETFLTGFLNCSSPHLADGAVQYLCMDHRHAEHVHRAARAAELSIITTAVWHKGVGGMGGLYRSAHEFIFVMKKGDALAHNNIGLGKHGRDRTNVWEFPGANQRGSSANSQLGEHATPKPVELVAEALLDVSDRGDAVIDPFLGSGTTLIAAQKTGRIAFGLELDPHYCDVILRRFKTFTGIAPVHAATGLSFREIANQRQGATSGEHPTMGSETNANSPVLRPAQPQGKPRSELSSADGCVGLSDIPLTESQGEAHD